MITLKELLNSSKDDDNEGLVNLDDWRWSEVEHLVDMGFEFEGDFKMGTPKKPRLIVYKKKTPDIDETKSKSKYTFYIEEPKKSTRTFNSFDDVIDYFGTYSQPELEKNM